MMYSDIDKMLTDEPREKKEKKVKDKEETQTESPKRAEKGMKRVGDIMEEGFQELWENHPLRRLD